MTSAESRQSAGGAILVLVLVTLLLLSTVVLSVTQQAVEVAEDHIFLVQSVQSAFQAEAAKDLVVERLGAVMPRSTQNGPQTASHIWAEGDLRITIFPTNAKLNLNALRRASGQPPIRQRLEQAVALVVAGSAPEASTEDILGWITPEERPDNASARRRSSDARYERKRPAYKPRKGPMQRPEELLLVHGFERFDPAWVRERFTIWGEDERVNINVASREILLALLPELEAYWPVIERLRGEQGFVRLDELLSRARLPMDLYQRILPHITVDATFFEALVELRQPAWFELLRIVAQREPLASDAPVRILAVDILESRPLVE